jgi:chlorobactene glucosyltransferase
VIHALLVAGVVATALAAILLPINLAAFPKLSRAASGRPAALLPRVSVVIPARNEEAGLERAVRSHLAQEYSNLQVVVVEDRSTDGTAKILEALSREDSRVTVVAGREPPDGWLGKPHALWLGSKTADGELFLFADADVRYHPRALIEALTVLEDRRLDLLAFFPKFETRGFWENVLIPYLSVGVFLGLGFLGAMRRFRPLAIGAGAGNLVRRRAYDAVGGHPALRDSVIDDVRLAITLKRAGYRVGGFRAPDRVVVRMYRGFREVWNGFTKNAAWVYSGFGGVLLFVLTVLLFSLSIVPVVVLVLAVGGVAVPGNDVRLAAALLVSSVLLRAVLAVALSDRLWPSITHPIMSAVWAGLIGRSLFHRFIRKRLTWRGREFDARIARF